MSEQLNIENQDPARKEVFIGGTENQGEDKDVVAKSEQELNAEKIEGASTFDELYGVIREIGEARGGHKTYTADELINTIKTIEEVGAGVFLDKITRAYGVRDKVRELAKEKWPHMAG